MREYTMRELRGLIRDGYAKNLEDHYTKDVRAYNAYLREIGPLDQIGYSGGTSGVTGCLMQSRTDGQWYAIVGRCAALSATV